MVQCKKCKLFISKTKGDTLVCRGQCEGVFHKACVPNIERFIQNEMCDSCMDKKQVRSPVIRQDPKKMTIESLLQEVNSKMEMMVEIKEKMEEIRNIVDFYSEMYEKLIETNKEQAEKIKKHENKLQDLANKNIYFEKCNKALEERIEYLEQKQMEKQVELVGVQVNENETLTNTITKIATQLKLNPEHINDIWRVGGETKNKSNDQKRPVIVSLRTREARQSWLHCRKQNLTNARFFPYGDNTRIFINEHVTKEIRQLFWQAKTRLKNIYKFVWIQNSKILARKDEGEAKIKQIRQMSDIEALLS